LERNKPDITYRQCITAILSVIIFPSGDVQSPTFQTLWAVIKCILRTDTLKKFTIPASQAISLHAVL
jgi:hypothetical protein